MCVDNPRYLTKALGHEADTTGLSTLEQKKEMLSYCYRSWSGLTKFIQKQCGEQAKCVDFPLVGRFFRKEKDDPNEAFKFTFVPHIDFIATGKFAFPQNEFNVSPLSKRVPKAASTVKVSLGAIGSKAEYDRELVASILKDVMVKFIEANRFGKNVRVNMRIGYLHAYPNGELQFENGKTGEDDDENDYGTAAKQRYQPRCVGSDQQMSEKNLEKLGRALSSNAPSVNMMSCF